MADEPVIWRPSWAQLETAADICVSHVRRRLGPVGGVYGVPRGGCAPAAMIAARLDVPILDVPEPNALVVDDLVDSGATAARFGNAFVALFRKSWSPRTTFAAHDVPEDAWVVFPWESNDDVPAADAVLRLAQAAGLDTSTLTERAAHVAPRAAELVAELLR